MLARVDEVLAIDEVSDATCRASCRMVMDAHLAALALEHGASIATTDRDFTRFPGVEIVNPIEAAGEDRRR